MDHHNAKRIRTCSPGSQGQEQPRLLSPPSSSAKKDCEEHTQYGVEPKPSYPLQSPPLGSDYENSKLQNIVNAVPQEDHTQCLGHKRRWTVEENFSSEPASKRRKTAPLNQTPPTNIECGFYSSLDHWATTGLWPANFSTMSNHEQTASPNKRRRTPSYTQSTKDGDVPKAHSAASEKTLASHWVLMDEQKGQSLVSYDSKELCATLLSGSYEEPQYTLFPISQFLLVWERVRNRNEARIFRDITPLLVPSAELLFMDGCEDLEHIAEEVCTDWTKGKTLGGPKPRPDLAIGVSATAFTEKEILKMKNYTSFEKPTLFTDNMYFPFLMCEVKCGEQGINKADRQNIHSSSIAVNAIVQLYKTLGDQMVSQLAKQILVFSISHDNERVKIYGHFAIIEEGKPKFYRYPVKSFTLNFDEGQGRKKTYEFVRELYCTFFPKHLRRIQSALAKIHETSRSNFGGTTADSQDSDAGALSSQDSAGFKPRDRPGQVAVLREQLGQQEKQNKEHVAQLERLYKEQVAQQEKQYKEQGAQQMAQQEKQYKEQLAQQMAQQEKQYKEQLAQQKEHLAQQEERFKEQIEMLKSFFHRE